MPTPDHQPDTPPHIVAWAELIAQPWLNGGGVTRQILSCTHTESGEWKAAEAEGWDWRVSIADVESSGAFSDFTGMTRILTVIEGESITLTVDGVVEELEPLRPFRFDGGAETSAQLPNGPIRDLNVIARTGRVNADVRIEALMPNSLFPTAEGQVCVLLAGHALVCSVHATAAATVATPSDAAEVELHLFDTVVGTSAHTFALKGEGTLAVITVSATA